MLMLEGNVAGVSELEDLQEVRAGLRAEVDALPVAIQRKYHDSIIAVDNALGKAINTLQVRLGLAEESDMQGQAHRKREAHMQGGTQGETSRKVVSMRL